VKSYFLFCIALTELLLWSCSSRKPALIRQDLNTGWYVCASDTPGIYPAAVPGSVHTDLMKAGIIPDPFYGDNEKKVQWISEHDWIYYDTFNLADDILENSHIDLVFKGLDTRCDVYLNNTLVLAAANMFRQWRLDAAKLLNPGSNTLRLIFYSPVEFIHHAADTARIPLPDPRAYLRKAPYHFGWDWGPELATSGIWKPVYLEAWESWRLEDVSYTVDSLDDERAFISARVTLISDGKGECKICIRDKGNGKQYAQEAITLEKGIQKVRFGFTIDNPRLWWPNGMGTPELYSLRCSVDDGLREDFRDDRIGLRTAELVTEKDESGESFYFRINGLPVFIKGANYIPMDHFTTRVTEDDYRDLILDAHACHMNMLRVWGGGIYESDIFYDLCDEYGIMVWQDFMYACNMYPGNAGFLENARIEAEEQVIRLRNHPSVVIWCGNNEVDEGWHNWGWQQQLGYSPADSAVVWEAYTALFHGILPGLLDRLDPGRPYHPSSPRHGWGRDIAYTEGDSHYWGVWWGEAPFETYREKTGRFMSEYGFQGFPDIQTIEAFAGPEDKKQDSEVLAVHQKHPRGFELIDKYMERWFEVPESFEDYVYVSQILQAEGIRIALEAHRKAMPRCMGTLYWQLNDTWPVISWSGRDYFGRWKALQYFVEKAYRESILVFEEKGDSVLIYSVSDVYQPFSAILEIKLFDTDGILYEESKRDIQVKPGSDLVWSGSRRAMVKMAGGEGKTILEATLDAGGEEYNAVHYFDVPKNISLREPGFRLQVSEDEKVIRILVSSEKPARFVHLSYPGEDHWFDRNYFDLLPGDTIEVSAFTKGNIQFDIQKPTVRSLWETAH